MVVLLRLRACSTPLFIGLTTACFAHCARPSCAPSFLMKASFFRYFVNALENLFIRDFCHHLAGRRRGNRRFQPTIYAGGKQSQKNRQGQERNGEPKAAAFCAFASGTAIFGLRLFQREREFRFRRRGMDGSRQWRKFIASGGTRETSEAYFAIAHAPHALPGIQSVGPAAHKSKRRGLAVHIASRPGQPSEPGRLLLAH